jgi:hypothetical protein
VPPVSLASFGDLALFRQSSWQWGEMHQGRLTTSRASAVLGLLEPIAAARMNVPRSLVSHHRSLGAYHHLLPRRSFSTLQEAAVVLCEEPTTANIEEAGQLRKMETRLWSTEQAGQGAGAGAGVGASGQSNGWARQYCARYSRRGSPDAGEGMAIRMNWGNVHEPAAILVALNTLHAEGARVSECGMFPSEALLPGAPLADEGGTRVSDLRAEQLLLLSQLHDQGCYIGASPDGLISHADGTQEVLEVKNHCPFAWNEGGGHRIRDFPPDAVVMASYVPQVHIHLSSPTHTDITNTHTHTHTHTHSCS